MKKMLVAAFLFVFVLGITGSAKEIVVTSTADSGPGTLRAALQQARRGDTVTFDPTVFPTSAPASIYLKSALPYIWQGNLTIDGSNAGVIVDGSKMQGDWMAGLQVDSNGNTIQGLQIVNFRDLGLALIGGASNNVIGGDRSIGSGQLGQGNLVSNNGIGIDLCDKASFNTITSNLVGTDVDGESPRGNTGQGIWIEKGCSHNTIGPNNVIAYNGWYGIEISGPRACCNTISQNSVYGNSDGQILLRDGGNTQLASPDILDFNQTLGTVTGRACAQCKVEVFSGSEEGAEFYEGETVASVDGSFSLSKGVALVGSSISVTATDPEGNTSGLASEFSTAAEVTTAATSGREWIVTSTADSGSGTLRWALQTARGEDTITFDADAFPTNDPVIIYLKSGLPAISQGNLTIEASDAGVIVDGSSVHGDWAPGLEIVSSGNTIRGLQILHFTGAGILLCCGAKENVIGGDRSIGSGPIGQGNQVSDNKVGILLLDKGTSSNVIVGNLVGTDVSGHNPMGNEGVGVHIEGGASHNVVGPDNIVAYNSMGVYVAKGATDNRIGPYNTIAFNWEVGVQIYNPGSVRNTITRNSIHDNAVIGILLNDNGNGRLKAPFISEFDLQRGVIIGQSCPGCLVELFSDEREEGAVFEGETTAASSGAFRYEGGNALHGPHLTATTTDLLGNTSRFSTPTSGTHHIATLQRENDLPRTRLQAKESRDLEDNRIGAHFCSLWQLEPEVFPDSVLDAGNILKLGLKSVRFAINDLDAPKADLSKPEFSIDPSHDEFITSLADNGVTMTYVLSFWDKEYVAAGGEVGYPRFKKEVEIQRYLDFVRFIVRQFKDRIEYYEIWNEPSMSFAGQWMEVQDYIELARRAVPVIRQEYPEAKIVVGGTHFLIDPDSHNYLFEILSSDIMPLVDRVSWHGMYGTSPEFDFHRQYYYAYPTLVQEIKDVASGHGFTGEYVAEELRWQTPDQQDTRAGADWPNIYSETKCAKYYTRGIIMNLGITDSVTQILLWDKPQWYQTIQNLCAAMAGNEATSIPAGIDIDYAPIAHYGFQFPNGDRMVAVWTDGIAQDDDPGVSATITFPGLVVEKVVGIDVLHDFEQELVFHVESKSTVVRDLLVKDYPILLRFSGVTESESYQELIEQKADRDGDGVPDKEDYCPDYPGDPAANGC